MDRSQWIVGGGARTPKPQRNGGPQASAAEDWLLSNGAAASASHSAAQPNGTRTPSEPPEDEALAAFYERTSRLQICVEEMDRRAKQVSHRVSRLASVLPTGPAQRSSRSKATAEPIRSIVEGWVPNRN